MKNSSTRIIQGHDKIVQLPLAIFKKNVVDYTNKFIYIYQTKKLLVA